MELCRELNASLLAVKCLQAYLGAPVHIQCSCWHNPAPVLRNVLFWKESFGWHLCKRKMQGANSALLRCTSGLRNSRCYPENSTLKPTNSASAPAAEEISALMLHEGIDQIAYLQTCIFASTLSRSKPVVEKTLTS